jgi:hypothetical protein
MIFLIRRWPWYIRWLTNEYTATYIHWLRGLCSSVENVFIGFGIEKYSTVIFLDTEEYLSIEQNTLFSCSEARLSSPATGINPKTLARLGPLPPPPASLPVSATIVDTDTAPPPASTRTRTSSDSSHNEEEYSGLGCTRLHVYTPLHDRAPCRIFFFELFKFKLHVPFQCSYNKSPCLCLSPLLLNLFGNSH